MDPGTERALRRVLKDFVTGAGTRRALPVTVYAGTPGAQEHDVPTAADQGLRTDLVARALDGLSDHDRALVWLTRSGGREVSDDDLAWHAAARTAFARHGLVLPHCVVITRRGWVDLVDGRRREWGRIRPRRALSPPARSAPARWRA